MRVLRRKIKGGEGKGENKKREVLVVLVFVCVDRKWIGF